jgi:hypothetical protein
MIPRAGKRGQIDPWVKERSAPAIMAQPFLVLLDSRKQPPWAREVSGWRCSLMGGILDDSIRLIYITTLVKKVLASKKVLTIKRKP